MGGILSKHTKNTVPFRALAERLPLRELPVTEAAAYEALKRFAADAVRAGLEVVMTVVGEPVTDAAKQARCRAICRELGATLRVRPYEA